MVLTTRVARASPSTSSAMIRADGRLGHLLQRRQQVADVADLLVEQQHEGVVQNRSLLFGVVDEVGREVAAVKLHAFDDVEFVVQGSCRLRR